MPYDDENKGALFRNERKTRDEQPGWRGSAKVDGKEYWISCWVNTAGPQAKNPGSKYMSLRFDPKEVEFESAGANGSDSFDDDVPF
jgi:hypothetical protein